MSYKHQLWWTGKLSLSQGHYKNLSSFYKSLLSLGVWSGWIFLQHLISYPFLTCPVKRTKEGAQGKCSWQHSRKLMVPALMGFLFAWDRATAATLQHLWCVSRWSLSHLGASTTCPPSLSSPMVPREERCPPPAPACEAAQCVILRLQVINHCCLWQSPCLKDETHSFYNFLRKK